MTLKNNRNAKSETLRVRLTKHQMTKLKEHAKKHGTTVSHIIHEYIRRLPNSKGSERSSLNSYQKIDSD